MDDGTEAAMDVGELGLRDVALAGWYLEDSAELVRGMPVGAADVVVDVGCGQGFAAQFCARHGARVLAIDHDRDLARAMRFALRGNAAAGSAALRADAGRLPLATGVASRVVCTELLQHVADPAATLAELARIGRADALYLVSVPGARQVDFQQHVLPPALAALPDARRVIDRAALAHLLEAAGFAIQREFDHGFFWSLWWALVPACGVGLDAPDHPVLAHWAAAWDALLASSEGRALKQRLDAWMPVSHAVLACKA